MFNFGRMGLCGLVSGLAGTPNPIPALGPAAYFQYGVGITESGGLVSQWDDQSGNGRHLKQPTGTNQPALQVDDSILFDGVDNVMKCDAFTLNQPTTHYLRMKVPTFTTNDTFMDGNAVFQGWMVVTNGATREVAVSAGTGSGTIVFPLDTYCVACVVFNGASSAFQLNNDAPLTGNYGAINPAGFHLGARQFGSSAANIEVREVAIFSVAHDAATRASVIAYLSTL